MTASAQALQHVAEAHEELCNAARLTKHQAKNVQNVLRRYPTSSAGQEALAAVETEARRVLALVEQVRRQVGILARVERTELA